MSAFSLNFPNNSALVTPLPALDPVVPTSELKPPTVADAVVVIDAQGTMHWCDVWAPRVNRYGDEALIPPEARCTKPQAGL
jgi:hypothetical protein